MKEFFIMPAPRIFTLVGILALSTLAHAQTPPTAYTITEPIVGSDGGTMTIYRSGQQVVMEYIHSKVPDGTPGHRSLGYYDLNAGVSHTWDPTITPPSCSVGKFSGDWGDPFASTAELTAAITKGDLKPTGSETISGIPTKVYAGVTQGTNLKVWLDEKDGLVLRMSYGAPGAAMQNMIDITKVSFAPPPASLFTMPDYCASVKPPPTPAELIAEETGDSADNFVNGIYGPGSTNSCSIVIRVVAAKTMAPVTRPWQFAIDTTFNQDHPSPYTFGVGNDGTSTFSGGSIHEITNQIHDDMLRIDNPPAYFYKAMNVKQPGHGTEAGMIYRQCFAPVTMLYYVMKDPTDIGKGADWLYAKSGKYAVVPAK
jgi:hypothetical protein